MLFNSYEFILIFLPITLLLFYQIGGLGYHRLAIFWLVVMSLLFYAYWTPIYLGLIVTSIIFNFIIGKTLTDRPFNIIKKILLLTGITVNLSLLGYFKYANFFINNLNKFAGSNFHLEQIILPLAISFFTFQQITYLVDTYNGQTREASFLHYCLFVSFFPQLIAGPIVHHKEMLPQFTKNSIYKFDSKNLSIGLTIFVLGLLKKVVLADGVAVYAIPVFEVAEQGVMLTFFEAWSGAIAYTFQLYFDFSGYSDMAIGIARLFGIRLPLNFHSPYKSVNIIEFWKRWHITLSRFLKEYLYIPLGGNRKGETRRYLNILFTMIIGGLWHGAGWTFVVWGALHGIYLLVNHAWRVLRQVFGYDLNYSSRLGRGLSRTVTFISVVVAWVFFRATSFDGAVNLLFGMTGMNGFLLPEAYLGYLNYFAGFGNYLLEAGFRFEDIGLFNGIREAGFLLFLFIISWCAPNTQQFMSQYKPAFEIYRGEIRSYPQSWLKWKPSFAWSFFIALCGLISILMMHNVSEFLYFNF